MRLKKIYFFLILAVIGTTIVSWFNVNSCLIILLVMVRLADGGRPAEALRTAFFNPYFLAYFSLFAMEALGLLYTHDLYTAYKHVESKATLVAIPFVLCSGKVIEDRTQFIRLLWAYCWLLVAACLLCLVVAMIRLRDAGHFGVFFYHSLTEVLGMNAVFFSAYVVIALIFLLSPDGKGRFRGILAGFFTVMMILLSSKLLLVWLSVVFVVYLRRRNGVRLTARQYAGLAALVVFGMGALALTKNPVGQRYRDILHDNFRYIGAHRLAPQDRFNGVSLRLLIWRFAGEIVTEEKAWVVGVTAGDSQDLLNRKYLAANIHPRYLGYNFHNQFIEIFVRSGAVGLGIFLLATGLLVQQARRTGSRAGWLILGMLLLLALTESTLEMQHSLFLFCFFPLVFGLGSVRAIIPSGLRNGPIRYAKQGPGSGPIRYAKIPQVSSQPPSAHDSSR